MAKGYWIVHVEVRDAETYDRYRAAVGAALDDFGGRFLVRGGGSEIREGSLNPRSVVIEFPSLADATACYDSPAYRSAKAIRDAAAEAQLVIAEGYDG
ncbi:DUF1330 domain-containing protein [Sulfitobacter sp. D35]|uniref:DUF1330 domain-containing protein n=1 Tax=Sulfitobacter sp. D35 TaxID=3083252 RepID=UPI00296F1F1D|nr:DUF1330 domain-containing protein [Sulfitobacter sp. D35]MDW4499624.1 DUF1330 domain-containing protein [Sulfitobacter sp. D35]